MLNTKKMQCNSYNVKVEIWIQDAEIIYRPHIAKAINEIDGDIHYHELYDTLTMYTQTTFM